MTTLTVLTSMVRNRTNLPVGDARVTDANITDLINQAINDAESEVDWPWREDDETINTVHLTTAYSMAADWRSTVSLTMVDPPRVMQRKTWKWTRRLAWPDLEGIPRFYTEYGRQLHVFPAPNGVYSLTHRYLKGVTLLVGGSDAVESPDWFDRIIVSKASSYVAQKLRDSEHYQMFEKMYSDQIKTATDDVHRSAEPIQVYTREDW